MSLFSWSATTPSMPKHIAASSVAVRFAILGTPDVSGAKLARITETPPHATAKVQQSLNQGMQSPHEASTLQSLDFF